MKMREGLLLAVYGAALRMYPAEFRAKYREPMLDAARRAQAEQKNDLRLLAGLLWEAGWSALREHWRAASPAKAGYVALFAMMVSGALLTTSVVYQQKVRRGANREPARVVAAIAKGVNDKGETIVVVRRANPNTNTILGTEVETRSAPDGEMRQELSSKQWLEGTSVFAAIYDPSGHVIAGTATLHGRLPQPPKGVFDYMRAHEEDWVSWQPEVGIRVALVGQRLPSGDFALAGQSIVRGETMEIHFNMVLWWIWVAAMLGLVGVFLVARQRAAVRG